MERFSDILPNTSARLIEGAHPQTCRDFRARVKALEAEALALGVTPGHRIGLLLPDGLDALALPLAVMPMCRVLPLNLAQTQTEIAAQIHDAGLDAVIVAAASGLPCREILLKNGGLQSDALPPPTEPQTPGLLLLTSGSTGTPKRVYLRPDQLIGSARTIADTLELMPQDCAVHALPMFHIGALVDLCLAPILSGGRLYITQGRDPRALAEAIRAGATWAQMVPTMLARCLAEWSDAEALALGGQLRFLRSVSSDLSADQHSAAQARLGGTPIVQMYGLTETAGQAASNPLDPAQQRPGTVGAARGAEISIASPDGTALPTGTLGEVCIKGPNVTEGYEGVPREDVFFGAWLRSGDMGSLDADGVLTLAGRLKEVINRGGEKVSALEVERAALAHDAVQEAAAFALPHPTLGEQVGLAVVGRIGEQALLDHLATRLAPYKCPRKITFCDSFPKLGSGKINKRVLAQRAETGVAAIAAEWQGEARVLAQVWADVLKTPLPVAEDDFFDAGGDSLSALAFLDKAGAALGRPVSPTLLFQTPRFADLVRAIADSKPVPPRNHILLDHLIQRTAGWQGDRIGRDGLIFAMGTLSDKAPVFFSAQGQIREIKGLLDPDRPLYAMPSIRDKKLRSDANCDWLAEYYADEIEALQPGGPLLLAGFCAGAHQMRRVADVMLRRGRDIQLVVAIDHWYKRPTAYPVLHVFTETSNFSASVLYHAPERALGHLHPKGAQALRVAGHHQQSFEGDLMAPLRPALERAIDHGLPVVATSWLEHEPRRAAYRAKLRLHAPRLLVRGRDHAVSVSVTNQSELVWPAYDESGLALVLHARNLDGFPRQRRLVHLPLTSALAPGASVSLTATIRYPQTALPVWLEAAMVDEGLAEFGQTRRLSWLAPLRG